MKRQLQTPENFWSLVDMSSKGCWEWSGARDLGGYGVIYWAGRNRRASRVAYEVHSGSPIEAGLLVCHVCDNPPCIRPDHLFLGTQTDNMRDAANKGRIANNTPSGEAHPLARVSDQAIREARVAYARREITQPEIARALGVSQTTVAGWMNGRGRREAGGPFTAFGRGNNRLSSRAAA